MRAVRPFLHLVGALDRYHGLDARYRREPRFALSSDAPASPLALAAPADFPRMLQNRTLKSLKRLAREKK